jgi:SPFH domain / Band 7 family
MRFGVMDREETSRPATDEPGAPVERLIPNGDASTHGQRTGREIVARFEPVDATHDDLHGSQSKQYGASNVASGAALPIRAPESQGFTAIVDAFKGIHIPPPMRGPWILDVLNLGIRRCYTVPDGFVMPVQVFGEYRTCKKPGLRAIWSWFGMYQRPYERLVPTREQGMEFDVPHAITSDPLTTRIDGFLIYKLVEPGKVLSEAVDFAGFIQNLAIADVRAEVGKRRYNDLNKAREELANDVKASLKSHADRWGVAILAFVVRAIVHETNHTHG